MTRVVNKNKDRFDVYIGRPSPFGNQFVIGVHGNREEVIDKYKEWFYNEIEENPEFKQKVLKLKDKTLGCFCRPQNKCHGDIIADYLDNIVI